MDEVNLTSISLDNQVAPDLPSEMSLISDGTENIAQPQIILPDELNLEIQEPSSSLKKRFFFTEIMSTAGPRKNFQDDARQGDYDLGEDVVGCFVRNNKAFFWLLDGTSDCPILKTEDGKELFSSRLLAQEMAWNIQQIIWREKDVNSSLNVLQESISNLAEDWRKKLVDLKESDKTDIIAKNSMRIESTTVIFGIMDIDGSIDISAIGDSVVITNPNHNEGENRGRLFAILRKDDELEKVDLKFNPFEDTRCNTFIKNDISSVLLVSDGVSQNTIKWLNLKPADFTDVNFRKTISSIKQGTCDDKALCIIQILTDD